MRSRAQKPPPQDPSRRALSMVHHSFSLHIGFHYKSNCSYLKEIETERFCCFIRVYFFDRLRRCLRIVFFIRTASKDRYVFTAYRLRPHTDGISPGLINMPPACLFPGCAGSASSIPARHEKKTMLTHRLFFMVNYGARNTNTMP